MEIKNAPNYAKNYEYIVAQVINGEYIFHAVYTNGFLADDAASELENGIVFHNVRIQGIKKKNNI